MKPDIVSPATPLAAEQDAFITIPPSAFSSISQPATHVGVIFVLYSSASLFPLRAAAQGQAPVTSSSSAIRASVVSPVLSASIATEAALSNITPPITVKLRLTGIASVRESMVSFNRLLEREDF